MSSFYLAKAKEEIERIWKVQVANTPFFKKIKAMIHFYKNFCKQKAQQNRATEASLRMQLAQVTRDLDDTPYCPTIQQQQGKLEEQLQTCETRKVVGQRLRSRLRWNFKGDHQGVLPRGEGKSSFISSH
jgi:hypothetical protein